MNRKRAMRHVERAYDIIHGSRALGFGVSGEENGDEEIFRHDAEMRSHNDRSDQMERISRQLAHLRSITGPITEARTADASNRLRKYSARVRDMHPKKNERDECSMEAVLQERQDCWLVSIATLVLKLPGLLDLLSIRTKSWMESIKHSRKINEAEIPTEVWTEYKEEQAKFRNLSPEDRKKQDEMSPCTDGGSSWCMLDVILSQSRIDHRKHIAVGDLMYEVKMIHEYPAQVHTLLLVPGFTVTFGIREQVTADEVEHRIRKGGLNHDAFRCSLPVFIKAVKAIVENKTVTVRGGICTTATHAIAFTICENRIIFCDQGSCAEDVMTRSDEDLKGLQLVIYGVDEFHDAHEPGVDELHDAREPGVKWLGEKAFFDGHSIVKYIDSSGYRSWKKLKKYLKNKDDMGQSLRDTLPILKFELCTSSGLFEWFQREHKHVLIMKPLVPLRFHLHTDKEIKSISKEQRLAIQGKIIQAVVALHKAGICHGNLCLDNFFATTVNSEIEIGGFEKCKITGNRLPFRGDNLEDEKPLVRVLANVDGTELIRHQKTGRWAGGSYASHFDDYYGSLIAEVVELGSLSY
jgi:hypothetical protein